MSGRISNARIDRLGDRLRAGYPLYEHDDDDLRLLDEWRASFEPAQRRAMEVVRGLGWDAAGRSMKSTRSIVYKLERETIRLSQVEDIAGCRIVVPDLNRQDAVVNQLQLLLKPARIFDRRDVPSFGYRAVHIVTRIDGPLVEVQVRTIGQHVWADMSEKFAIAFDPGLKYGDVTTETARIAKILQSMSENLYDLERKECGSTDRAEIMKSMYFKAELIDHMRKVTKGNDSPP